MGEQNIIEIKDLNVSYSDTKALDNLSLNIPKGSKTAIVGPNGSGKSTLIKSILGLINIESGEIKVYGKNVSEVSKNIAYVPQKSSVNWDFPTTVIDVVLMGRYAHLGITKRPTKQDLEISLNALKKMKMEQFSDRQISELSGGQRQRVFIARALAQEVDLYILDEPLTGVDVKTEEIIALKFDELQKKGKTIVAVHHNIYTLENYFDYLVIMNKNVKVQGKLEDINKDEYINLAFRG